ncbi:ClC family H(+)/Cl(-) exchange transporter [Streptococcus pseudoporcinus]|uniref:Voltage gated chloride channel family protein n=1 Tax=Streptococcus pseudoporcinus TaxID=361101 RepID=A0A4U9XLD6_9STRE|nr:ClC family H(+)/Cl(-) exchange transporter [Streptococcus pseudoporcinus]VTS14184.1 voltage gated chloride channel family protein [Streptococcus pseudoporcinus]VUC67061.1 voltage gated chloride channel family protein [Streptococcus pseudoporcinus]VUC97989.1 voltage gated chloride channel family protein [Streptococcus pseudoporcinus]VUC98380.1 voltage gated chloride channel family protein [Streptococcus pseudoporcinus]
MENHKNEYAFSNESIISFVWRGILVGSIAGVIVSLFRLLIEKLSHLVVVIYRMSHDKPSLVLAIIAMSVLILLVISQFIASEPDIKGSGIPHVEGELKGLLAPTWWPVLWKKFIAGVLAISMGFMLGREGPSIQLGAMAAKGLSTFLKSSRLEKRVLIASGAAAGLSAAFNAPIAGLLFVVEEIYHHFSRLIWITALVASLVANFISLHIFGLEPILAMPKAMPFLDLNHYWLLILLGAVLGGLGYIYERIILVIPNYISKLCSVLHLSPKYQGLIPLILIIPIGYYFPQLLGGGNGLIIGLSINQTTLVTVCLFFILRFIGSMFSYGSGLPGGIFLPILTLGALLGLIFGLLFQNLGLLEPGFLPLFIVLGMAGYFAAISKAPLTGMLLVTEMVGDLKPLMAIAVVTFVAYFLMDLLKGAPIYEAMLEEMPIMPPSELVEPTLVELTVSDHIAGRYVRDLKLPDNVLITTQVHHGRSQVVSGDTLLMSGATIFMVVNESEVGHIRQLVMSV